MLGHKSIKTTEVYVRANKQHISEQMNKVKEQLFGEGSGLQASKSSSTLAKVVNMRAV